MNDNAERHYQRPSYRITLDEQDITPKINGRLIPLCLRAQRGLEADQLDLTFSDHDGALALPRRGVSLRDAYGWQDEGLIDKGLFTVDEVQHSGTPDQITIRARSADMRGRLPGKRSRSWHDITIGEIIDTIAKRHTLEPVVGDTVRGIRIGHIDQTEESDLNFLTRLGERFDAVATVKAARLLFTQAGEALTAITLTRRDGDRHRYSATDRDTYTGVIAYWNDKANAERQRVIAGSDEDPKELRSTYATEADALDAAKAEWRRLQRGGASFTLDLAEGRPELYPETPVTLSGWKGEIDATAWLITEVGHDLSDRALTSSVEMEVMGI